MKKLIIMLFCVLLVLCCTGCKSEVESTTNAPDTTIDPNTINWGYDEESDKADRWYLTETDDVIYIYFTVNSDDEICTYNLVKSGVVIESTPCTVTEDNHLIPVGSEATFDLVFKDYFNAYDFTTDSTYSRGNADEYNSYFAGREFIDESGKHSITFGSNNTYSELTSGATNDSASTTGKWEIIAPKALLLSDANNEILYSITYNDDMSVKSIEYNKEVYYAQYAESETINKYKAY